MCCVVVGLLCRSVSSDREAEIIHHFITGVDETVDYCETLEISESADSLLIINWRMCIDMCPLMNSLTLYVRCCGTRIHCLTSLLREMLHFYIKQSIRFSSQNSKLCSRAYRINKRLFQ